MLKLGEFSMLTAALIMVTKQLKTSSFLNINETLQNTLQWIDSLGKIGYLVFILVYVLAAVFLISGAILTLGAGVIFNVVKGSIIVSIASTLGATVAFLIGRYLARGWVNKQLEKYPKFRAIDHAVGQEGWKIVGLTRLSPLFPFVILNYAFGITKVSLRDYILASWIGMMPGTIMYVYLGSLIGNIATLGAGERAKTPLEWGLYLVGLIATVLVTVYVTKIAQKALNNQIEEVSVNRES
ncbi:TVP38/TMEM64 family protein [Crocosphaera sp. XPORK-15E]|uniref:TVP38/TMEM64 family protein n=1 Tax=Crocosphaera sp. XPORK-15E TaxID=3110247 RepID=UPI003A4D85EE